jgi:hypothetical protein
MRNTQFSLHGPEIVPRRSGKCVSEVDAEIELTIPRRVVRGGIVGRVKDVVTSSGGTSGGLVSRAYGA